jgi:hypothetical protein
MSVLHLWFARSWDGSLGSSSEHIRTSDCFWKQKGTTRTVTLYDGALAREMWSGGLNWEQELWRYVAVERFAWIVQNSRLCFAATTEFADAFEVTPGTKLDPDGLTVTVECCPR